MMINNNYSYNYKIIQRRHQPPDDLDDDCRSCDEYVMVKLIMQWLLYFSHFGSNYCSFCLRRSLPCWGWVPRWTWTGRHWRRASSAWKLPMRRRRCKFIGGTTGCGKMRLARTDSTTIPLHGFGNRGECQIFLGHWPRNRKWWRSTSVCARLRSRSLPRSITSPSVWTTASECCSSSSGFNITFPGTLL